MIRPHPSNPRQGDVGALVELIKKNGFYGHCVVQRSTGYILAGNHRYKAAVAVGMAQVPVQWLDVNDDLAERILLSDNRSSDLASYDNPLLEEMLTGRASLEGTGFDGDALDQLIADNQGRVAELNAADEQKSSGGAPIIQHNIVFDDEVQQRRWFTFINQLRQAYPEIETIAGRVIAFVEAHPLESE